MSTFTTSTLEQMQSELASLPAHDDIPTQRERSRVAERRQNLTWRISGVKMADHLLAKVNPQIDTLTKWVDDLTRLRGVIAARLLQAASDAAAKGERGSLRAKTVQEQFSLIKIDRGFDVYEATPVNLLLDDLLVAEGYERGVWHGTLDYATRRLGELTKQRAVTLKEREQMLREYRETLPPPVAASAVEPHSEPLRVGQTTASSDQPN